MYHIPVCPFSQRIEVLLALKGITGAVDFQVVDITRPRPEWLLAKSRGSTALPILDLGGGRVIRESMVILRYIEDRFPDPQVARRDPYERAIENMLVTVERRFAPAGYRFVMNQDRGRRQQLEAGMLGLYAEISDFLEHHGAGTSPYLFEDFGFAEAVFTPFFQRFWFLEYYEGFELPDESRFRRVAEWSSACKAHPAAQQVSREEIVKLYYDYAKNAGNGAMVPGRQRSSFVFEPHWKQRPWPPADKYGVSATDEELGLL